MRRRSFIARNLQALSRVTKQILATHVIYVNRNRQLSLVLIYSLFRTLITH